MDGQTNIMIKLLFKNKLTGCFYRYVRQCSGSGVIMASSRDVVAPFFGSGGRSGLLRFVALFFVSR